MSEHQPFESWILGEAAPTEGERRLLSTHLGTCAACRELESGWREVESRLRAAPQAAPRAGFTARWHQRAAERRQATVRRLTWLLLLASLGGAVLVGLPLVMELETVLASPGRLLVGWLNWVTNLLLWARLTRDLITAAAHSLPSAVPAAWWLGSAAALLGLFVLWVASLYRFALHGAWHGGGR